MRKLVTRYQMTETLATKGYSSAFNNDKHPYTTALNMDAHYVDALSSKRNLTRNTIPAPGYVLSYECVL